LSAQNLVIAIIIVLLVVAENIGIDTTKASEERERETVALGGSTNLNVDEAGVDHLGMGTVSLHMHPNPNPRFTLKVQVVHTTWYRMGIRRFISS
jgi:hypothetical protein